MGHNDSFFCISDGGGAWKLMKPEQIFASSGRPIFKHLCSFVDRFEQARFSFIIIVTQFPAVPSKKFHFKVLVWILCNNKGKNGLFWISMNLRNSQKTAIAWSPSSALFRNSSCVLRDWLFEMSLLVTPCVNYQKLIENPNKYSSLYIKTFKKNVDFNRRCLIWLLPCLMLNGPAK